MTVHAAQELTDGRCAARLVPEDSVPRLQGLAIGRGLCVCLLPETALPGGVRSRPGADVCVVLLAGAADAIERARTAFELGEHAAFIAALDLPPCCARHAARHDPPRPAAAALVLPESLPTHPLLAPLGLSVLPIRPCAPDCPSVAEAAERRLAQAAAQGYVEEVGWLRECLSWGMVRSDLHGVTEIKTPVFKLSMEGASEGGPGEIRRLGPTWTEGAVVGLRFPFAAPAKLGRDSHRRHAL
jgi:hypothetical protein